MIIVQDRGRAGADWPSKSPITFIEAFVSGSMIELKFMPTKARILGGVQNALFNTKCNIIAK